MDDMLQTSILISLNPRHAQIGALIGNSKALTCSRRSYLRALPQKFRTLMRDLLNETDTSKMATLMKHVNDMLRHEHSSQLILRQFSFPSPPRTMNTAAFEAWRSKLRDNCSREGKLGRSIARL